MKALPIVVAVACHYLFDIYFEEAAMNLTVDLIRLLVLMGVCLNVCAYIKDFSSSMFPKATFLSFIAIKVGFFFWILIEKVVTHFCLSIVNEKSSLEGMNKVKLILIVLAVIFFIQAFVVTVRDCPESKSLSEVNQKANESHLEKNYENVTPSQPDSGKIYKIIDLCKLKKCNCQKCNKTIYKPVSCSRYFSISQQQ